VVGQGGVRTDYRMQMLNDLDAKATSEAVITKDAESDMRQWANRRT